MWDVYILCPCAIVLFLIAPGNFPVDVCGLMGRFWCLGYECLSGRIHKCFLSRLRKITVPHCLVALKSLVEVSFHFEALGTRKIWTCGGSILCYSMHLTSVRGGSCQCIQKPEGKVQREQGQALSSGTQ